MGDVGYLDGDNRFWFCGRKSHRVTTTQGPLFTIPCESIYNNHPAVFRSALVGVGPRDRQEPVALCTIVETEGSTYRKAGARMLVDANGIYYGVLGGGCFEGDLVERARTAISTGKPSLVEYDMRGDEELIWGLGLR